MDWRAKVELFEQIRREYEFGIGTIQGVARKFGVHRRMILVWACHRLAWSVMHFLQVLDEFGRLNIEFISFREQIDTEGALGKAILVIVGAIAELERSLIKERVKAGLRRAKLEGRHIGRPALHLDHEAVLEDRARGMSLNELARKYQVSRASICKALKEA